MSGLDKKWFADVVTSREDVARPQGAARVWGRYADGRKFLLPVGWPVTSRETLDLAVLQALKALKGPDAETRVRTYYDPELEYSGASFLSTSPNSPFEISAADLWAVSTLSITVTPRQGRLLTEPGPASAQASRQLRRIPADVPITDLDVCHQVGKGGTQGTNSPAGGVPLLLDSTWNLHQHLSTLLASEIATSRRWVFAAKLSARKRPLLVPVRDNLVCKFLTQGKALGDGPGRLGLFSQDMQAFAYLATHPGVRSRLAEIRHDLSGINLDEDLRLLDTVLWTYARWRS